MTQYIRYFEAPQETLNALQEMYPDLRLRPSKQGDAIRIEGPLARKKIIDAVVEKYDEGLLK